MSVALHGNLRDFGIGEVFQLIGHQRKTGVLEVSGEGDRLRIAFDHGSVVYAEQVGAYERWALGDLLVRVGLLTPERLLDAEEQLGEGRELRDVLEPDLGAAALDEIAELCTSETIFHLLGRQRGSFHFTPEAIVHGRDPKDLLPAEQILMDGLRMVDEWNALDPLARADDTVFRRESDFESFRAEQTHESPARLGAAERLFLLIDGRLTLRRVVDLSRLGSFEGARWLSVMHRAGLIAPVQAKTTSGLRVEADGGGWLRPLLAAVPFVALLALAALAWQQGAPAPPVSVWAEPDVARRAAVDAYGRRLRLAIDAHQIEQGTWPKRLDTLVGPADGARWLAGASAAPYYYARRGGGYVLLPPAP